MNLVKVLPFLFLHVYSLELNPLVVESDTCKRLLQSEGLEPDCKFETSKSAGPLEVTCPEEGVLRIVGDYDIVRIDCEALFPIDFHYTGNKPTEAVVPEFYSILNATDGQRDYHIQVFIYGLTSLQRLHSSDRKHNYSRTGRFSFQGLERFSGFSKSFYIFLEEPELSPNFITNRETEWPKFESNNVCATVPCISTHFHSVVSLTWPESRGAISSIYKPTAGLRVCGLSSPVEAFTCQLNHEGHSVTSKSVHSVPSPYGLPRGLEESVDVNITYTSEWRDKTTIETFTDCNVRPGSNLATIGASNPASYRLLRDFVLPNRSYSVLISRIETDGALKTNTTTALAGATYCGDSERYRLTSFSVDFEPSVAVLDFDIDWKSYFASSNAKYSKMWLDASEELEENTEVDFTCTFNGFLFVPPAIWDVETADGQVRRVINDIWADGISTMSVKATRDLKKVTCNAPIWYLSTMEPMRAAFITANVKPQLVKPPTPSTTSASATMATTRVTLSTVIPAMSTTRMPVMWTTSMSTTMKPSKSPTVPAGEGFSTAVIVIAVVAGLLLCGLLALFVCRKGKVAHRIGQRALNTNKGCPRSGVNGSSSSPNIRTRGSLPGKHIDASNLRSLLPPGNESKNDLVSTKNNTIPDYLGPLSKDETTL